MRLLGLFARDAEGEQARLAAGLVDKAQPLAIEADRGGRGGGLALTAAGRTARLGDVVRSLEDDGDTELVDCSGLDCPLQSACRLRAALAQAKAAFYASLNTTTVADLAQPPTRNLLISLGALAAQIDSRTD